MRGFFIVLGGAMVIVLGWWWLQPKIVMIDPAVTARAEGAQPECPHSPEFMIVDSVRKRPPRVYSHVIREVPQSGIITDIPEFHDCQRFIVDSAGEETYGALHAIYASFRLSELDSIIDSVQRSLGADTLVDTAGVAAATIYSYGDGYEPLGIGPGFNCLYMSQTGSGWSARMVRRGKNDPNCPIESRVNRVSAVTRLDTKPVTTLDYPYNHYPPVARWDWDPNSGRQYIGIRCGAAWCEVSRGVTSSQPSVTAPRFADLPPELAEVTAENQPVVAIKGWHDAQRLAISRDGKTIPSNVWGVIVPHPLLEQQTKNQPPEWFHAATAVVSEDYDGVALKLRRGQPYRIHLCYGSADVCTIPAEQVCVTERNSPRWWAKGTYRLWWFKPVAEYRCIENVDHSTKTPPVHVPGTARWRWLARDETTWTRCEDGCCKLM